MGTVLVRGHSRGGVGTDVVRERGDGGEATAEEGWELMLCEREGMEERPQQRRGGN